MIMNEYLIYTTDGFCQDPYLNDIENCQVLGRAKGKDKAEAIDNLLSENQWIIDSGYERKNFVIVQIVNSGCENTFDKALADIEEQLLFKHNTKEESLNEIKRYMKEFPQEADYNIVQYGNLLVYYHQIREFYNDCGCDMTDKSNDEVWELYKSHVGQVAKRLLNENEV